MGDQSNALLPFPIENHTHVAPTGMGPDTCKLQFLDWARTSTDLLPTTVVTIHFLLALLYVQIMATMY